MKTTILGAMLIFAFVGVISGYASCWVDLETQPRLIGTAFVSFLSTVVLPLLFLPIMVKD